MTTSTTMKARTEPEHRLRKWIPLIAICLGTFMLLVDVTIVNVALPPMTQDLHSSFTSLQWVVDMYALVLAALLMLVGALGDRLGHRRLYLVGLAVFAIASLACGLAPDAGTLTAARGIQGVGGAAMLTSTTSLLAGAYEGRDRGTAFGIWGAVSGAAAAVGPILGGVLTDQINWRAIFMVNLPIAAVAISMTAKRIRRTERRAEGRLDYAGAAAFTVFAGTLVYGLIQAADKGWGSSEVLGCLGGAGAALALFAVIEVRTERPLFQISLMRQRGFAGLMIAALLYNAAAFAHLTYTSIWLQSVLGLSPIKAGLIVCPLAVVAFLVAANSARLFGRLASQIPIGAGLILIGGGALLMSTVSAGSSWPAIIPGLVLTGVGVGVVTPILMSSALATVSRDRVGMASGAVNTARQLGYALGIAVLGTVFASRVQDYVSTHTHVADPHALASALSGGRARAVLSGNPGDGHLVHAAFATGLDHTYVYAGLIGVAAGLVVLALVRQPRGAASSH